MHFFGLKGRIKIKEYFTIKLFRSMNFLACFLHEFGQGDKSVEDAMNKSYGQTLKRFHGWMTRGIFSVNYLFI